MLVFLFLSTCKHIIYCTRGEVYSEVEVLIRVIELRQREVINVVDGKRLGMIKDIDLDLEAGKVRALILPSQGGRFKLFFGREEDLIIPWENVIKIGVDVILVKSHSSTVPLHKQKS
ncbi:MAG: hypothetical protein PWP31_656 [Clostridia bacterium]|nr:hypothetical protein [Clostridia bacterium]